jgi:hypothetical protein
MNAINNEDGGYWTPKTGESIRGCVNPWIGNIPIPVQSYADCGQCGEVPYRVLVIESKQGKPRGVALCGLHFVQACKQCSDKTPCLLDDNERRDLIRDAIDSLT